MSHSAELDDDLNLPHLLALLGGGLCLGTGILNLYYAFGWDGGKAEAQGLYRIGMNEDITHVGFNGLDNISALGAADYAIPLVVIGLILMVWANATAWKRTHGW